MRRTNAKERRYGGAERICDVSAEKSMLRIIVGRKTGRDAKETLIERKMRACSQWIGLDSVLTDFEDLRRERTFHFAGGVFSSCIAVLSLSCRCSSWSRSRATFLSRGVRYRAVSGESGMKYQANIAVMMLGKPSNKNRARHGSIGPSWLSLTMTQARLLAKLVASGAAEIWSPTR